MSFNVFNASTAALIGVVTAMHKPSTFLLDRYFPELITFSTDMIMFDEILDDEELMPIVSPALPAKERALSEFKTHTARAPYLNEITAVPLTRGTKRVPGEALGGELDLADRINLAVLDEFVRKENRIKRRHEFMAAQILRTGGFTIAAEGYENGAVTMQFTRPNSLQVQLLTTARWGESGVSPMDNLESWATAVEDESGIYPTEAVMGIEAFKLLRADPKFNDALDLRRGGESTIQLGPLSPDEVSRGTYRGTLGKLDIFTYSQSYKVGGSRTRYIGDYDVILAGAGIEGARAAGAIQAFAGMDLNTAQLQNLEVEIFHRAFPKTNPDAYMANSQSGACPVPRRINASGCWTVR